MLISPMRRVNELVSNDIGNYLTNKKNWDLFYNAKVEGLKGDGVTNDYAAFSALIAKIGTAEATIIFAPGTYKISTSITIPSNINLYLTKGAMLSPDSGDAITINGPIEAGLWQIFTGAGTIVGGPKVKEVYPEWFGAKGDGVTDDTNAIARSVDLVSSSGGGTVFISDKTYMATQIKLKSKVTIMGNSMRAQLKQLAGSDVDFIVLENTSVEFFRLANLYIHGNKSQQGVGGYGIYINSVGGSGYSFYDQIHTFENLIIYTPKKSGLYVSSDNRELTARNVYVTGADMYGFEIYCTDARFSDCTAGSSGLSGWRINGPNNRFTNCKGFGSGRLSTVGDMSGFVIRQPRNVLSGCEAQDNGEHGFLILSTSSVQISGIADSNGVNAFAHGVRIDNSTNCLINVMTMNRNGTTPQQSGVNLSGTSSSNQITLTTNSLANRRITGDDSSGVIGNSFRVDGDSGVQEITYAVSVTPDPFKGGTIVIALTGNITIVEPTGPYHGMKMKFIFKQDASGSRTINFQSKFIRNWSPDITANKINIIEFMYSRKDDRWYQSAATIGL